MTTFAFLHNYHTHTTYCRHARNTVEEMIEMAIKNGYRTIGFSEHAPLKVHRNFRLNLHSWSDYIQEVNALKKKYKGKIKVLCGLETEYHKSAFDYYQTLRKTKGIDYMILGNHNEGDPHLAKEWNAQRVNLKQYGIQLVDGIKSGLFSAVAHPDYIFRYYPK
jgi:histidinol-phosphatase (PHP family)